MSKNDKSNYTRIVTLRFRPEEYVQVTEYCKTTTCRKLSVYARNVLLKKPVVVKYRNQSADEFLAAMIPLRDELHAIGVNFNQAVKKLNALNQIPEFRAWLVRYETDRDELQKKVTEIKERLNQLYQWLRG